VFKEMRRKDREMVPEEIEEVLTKGEYGFFSTISDNGYPYTVPVNYVYHDQGIFFHCAGEGHKLENMHQNPRVSFCVVTDTEVLPEKFSTKYKSVVAFGSAREITGDLKEEVLFQLIHKYAHDFLEKGKKYIENAKEETTVIKIDIHHMTGKARK